MWSSNTGVNPHNTKPGVTKQISICLYEVAPYRPEVNSLHMRMVLPRVSFLDQFNDWDTTAASLPTTATPSGPFCKYVSFSPRLQPSNIFYALYLFYSQLPKGFHITQDFSPQTLFSSVIHNTNCFHHTQDLLLRCDPVGLLYVHAKPLEKQKILNVQAFEPL